MLHAGIDIGSKTIKLVVLDEQNNLVYESYTRHLSNVKDTLAYTVQTAARQYADEPMTIGFTGSAGMHISQAMGCFYTQEVIAAHESLKQFIPDADVCIEIGGEDSKILFLTDGEEMRMNSTCAGGTGGFIDTIAGMLDINAEKLNFHAYGCTTVYPIASRCAVFAQSDVRPLINEGVSKEDIAGSVFDAVVTQCITGLACGRQIKGKVAMLGGPLHFLSYLRERFRIRLGLNEEDLRVPAEGHLFVAMGAALAAAHDAGAGQNVVTLNDFYRFVEDFTWDDGMLLHRLDQLFTSKEEYQQFRIDHAEIDARRFPIASYEGPVYLGVDSGSEAIKFVLIGEEGQVLRTYYQRSAGNVIDAAQEMFKSLWKYMPLDWDGSYAAHIAHACVTGYGEGYLKAAYAFDSSEVETVAHVRAAQELVPDADFIMDIGGQDMKCIYLRDGRVDNVVLNEACSSGCGALLSGMAWSMDVNLDTFVEKALYAESPVDLGTRCTVFMTSRVRHAQKEGASVGDLAAGLAYSVIRNALYKVIRMRDVAELGEKIVVQGGTFSNDAVLRAFEKLLGREVIRPEISSYMGAYGAALLARDKAKAEDRSTIIPMERVNALQVKQRTEICKKCSNACTLIKTTFSDQGEVRAFTVGNRCDRGADEQIEALKTINLFEVRNRRMFQYRPLCIEDAPRGEIGLVRALDMYDLYPFWVTLLTRLGFRTVLSRQITGTLRGKALETIPAESLCYPAKIAHEGMVDLVERGVQRIFIPYVSSVRGEALACPVVSGYPLILDYNMDLVHEAGAELITPHFQRVLKGQVADDSMVDVLRDTFEGANITVTDEELTQALAAAAAEQCLFQQYMKEQGDLLIEKLKQEGGQGIVCAGRPYHIDPAVHHGIPELLCSYGYSVFTEDSIVEPTGGSFGSWEYPDRLIAVAQAIAEHDNINMVQLYSFGCGLDAVSVDRVRDELESNGKSLTALKIDEMVDLASIRIRIRSMQAAQEGRIGYGANYREAGDLSARRPTGSAGDLGAFAPQPKLVLYDYSKHPKRGKLSVWREAREQLLQ